MLKKTILNLGLLILLSFGSYAQTDNRCDCIQQFAAELELIDSNKVENLSDSILNTFKRLKRKDENFRRCSDYYSIETNMWTLGKLRIVLMMGRCEISPKAKTMLEEGPLIYEMNFGLQAQMKAEHKAAIYEEERDSLKIKEVLAKAENYMRVFFSMDTTEYGSLTVKQFLDFHGKENVYSQFEYLRKMEKEMDMQLLKVEVIPIDYLIKQKSKLSSVVRVDYSLSIKGEEKKLKNELVAMSNNNGKDWFFIDKTRTDLDAIWVVVDDVYPIALEEKLKKEKIQEIDANSAAELGASFCECMNKIKEDDFMKKFVCMEQLKKHPVFQAKDEMKKLYEFVKANCEKYTGSLIFFSVDKD